MEDGWAEGSNTVMPGTGADDWAAATGVVAGGAETDVGSADRTTVAAWETGPLAGAVSADVAPPAAMEGPASADVGNRGWLSIASGRSERTPATG